MIARHIGVVGARHRLRRTAAAGARCAGVNGVNEETVGNIFNKFLSWLFDDSFGRAVKARKGRVPSMTGGSQLRTESLLVMADRPASSPTPAGAMMWLVATKPTAFYRLAHWLRLLPLCGSFGIWPARAAPEIGEAAPALVVTALDGTTFDLAKLRGKVVLVNYWATWCAPAARKCRSSMRSTSATTTRAGDHRHQHRLRARL